MKNTKYLLLAASLLFIVSCQPEKDKVCAPFFAKPIVCDILNWELHPAILAGQVADKVNLWQLSADNQEEQNSIIEHFFKWGVPQINGDTIKATYLNLPCLIITKNSPLTAGNSWEIYTPFPYHNNTTIPDTKYELTCIDNGQYKIERTAGEIWLSLLINTDYQTGTVVIQEANGRTTFVMENSPVVAQDFTITMPICFSNFDNNRTPLRGKMDIQLLSENGAIDGAYIWAEYVERVPDIVTVRSETGLKITYKGETEIFDL